MDLSKNEKPAGNRHDRLPAGRLMLQLLAIPPAADHVARPRSVGVEVIAARIPALVVARVVVTRRVVAAVVVTGHVIPAAIVPAIARVIIPAAIAGVIVPTAAGVVRPTAVVAWRVHAGVQPVVRADPVVAVRPSTEASPQRLSLRV